MSTLYRFLSSNEILIYLLLALGGVIAIRWLWNSWHEWQNSVFGLEREFALRRFAQAVAISLLIMGLAFAEVFVASFVAPSLPSSAFLGTPTLDLLSAPSGAAGLNVQDVLATPVPLPEGTTVGNDGCVPGELEITSPKTGQEVSGSIELIGTVNIPNFGFYKYEYAQQGSDNWVTISAWTQPVVDGSIGQWDTSTLTPGDYQLRVVATDNKVQALAPCVIPVRVVASQ